MYASPGESAFEFTSIRQCVLENVLTFPCFGRQFFSVYWNCLYSLGLFSFLTVVNGRLYALKLIE